MTEASKSFDSSFITWYFFTLTFSIKIQRSATGSRGTTASISLVDGSEGEYDGLN